MDQQEYANTQEQVEAPGDSLDHQEGLRASIPPSFSA
jgi:hypothetical protein